VIRIKVGDKYVEFVTEDALHLTDDIEKAGYYTWEGQVEAEKLIKYHLVMNEALR
jgi:hypothetical protein